MVRATLQNGCSRTPKTCPASMTPVTHRQYRQEHPPNQTFYCRKRAAGPRRWVASKMNSHLAEISHAVATGDKGSRRRRMASFEGSLHLRQSHRVLRASVSPPNETGRADLQIHRSNFPSNPSRPPIPRQAGHRETFSAGMIGIVSIMRRSWAKSLLTRQARLTAKFKT